ncbi:hypothetical protein MHU86_9213 [Fragilaria crotonensis]|nr:hypothetical protein MHU86_9213 [Fragilaria crotonensis]
MVQTRSGNVVIHTEASYGRAARSESSRKRRKRKAENDQNAANATTPRRRAPTRSQIQYDEALATPPGASARVGSTPSPNKTDRILRGTTRKPRCSDFGKTRHFAFHGQGFMFCNACDLWDALPPDATNKVSIDSLKFGCTANHTYFSHPTTLRKQDCYIRRKRKVVIPILNVQRRVVPNYGVAFNEESDSSFASSFDGEVVVVDQGNGGSSAHHNNNNSRTTTTSSTDDPSDNDDNQPILGSSTTNAMPMDVIATTTAGVGSSITDVESSLLNVQQHALVVEQLKGKIALLQERNDRLVREVKALQCKVMKHNATTTDEGATVGALSTSSRNESFTQQVLAALNGVLQKHRRWSANRVGALVAKAVWNHDTYLPHLLRHARKHLREKVFTTYNILREMDLAGGTLSYEGIEVLRRVETCGVKRFRGSMIPSKSELKRMAGVVEWFAREHCPFELQQTKKGESVQFNYGKAMLCITQAFHLDTIGKLRSLSIASSIDGASLSKNLSVIAGGIKITDRAARCPITCRPLLDNPCTMSAQSRNLCIPLKIMMGRETKETFVEFGSLSSFLTILPMKQLFLPRWQDFYLSRA